MITVRAAQLRKNLFDMLARVSAGEVITVRRNGEEVALIVPKFLVPPEQAFATMENEEELADLSLKPKNCLLDYTRFGFWGNKLGKRRHSEKNCQEKTLFFNKY